MDLTCPGIPRLCCRCAIGGNYDLWGPCNDDDLVMFCSEPISITKGCGHVLNFRRPGRRRTKYQVLCTLPGGAPLSYRWKWLPFPMSSCDREQELWLLPFLVKALGLSRGSIRDSTEDEPTKMTAALFQVFLVHHNLWPGVLHGYCWSFQNVSTCCSWSPSPDLL